MKYIYFTTPLKASIIDWDGISQEPPHIARFPAQNSDFSDRYILHEGNLIDKYLGMPDTQAMIADLEAKAIAPPIIPQGYAPAPQPTNTITPVALKLRFTSSERVAIYASADPAVVDFLKIIDDPRLQLVDKDLTATQEAFNYFVGLGLLTATRKTEILS